MLLKLIISVMFTGTKDTILNNNLLLNKDSKYLILQTNHSYHSYF